MIVLRRPAGLRAGLARARWQSTKASDSKDASASETSTPAPTPVMPERIAKFRRTSAPIMRELSGVHVPAPKQREDTNISFSKGCRAYFTIASNSTQQPTQAWPFERAPAPKAPERVQRTRKALPDADTYNQVTRATLESSVPSSQRRDGGMRAASRGPKKDERARPERSSNSRPTRSPRRGLSRAKPEAEEEEVAAFDVSQFVASQNLREWKNAEGEPLSEEEVAEARKSLLELMQAQPVSESTNTEGGELTASQETPESFECFVDTRSASAALQTPSHDVSPVPWNFTRQAHPNSSWERKRYTANPSPSAYQQKRLVNNAQSLFARSMKDPKGARSKSEASSTPVISQFASSVSAKGVEASRGAQLFRRELLAGDYAKHTLTNVKTSSPASLTAKVAVLANDTMPLEDKFEAIALVRRIAP